MSIISKTQIFVRGFSSKVTEVELREAFKKYGKIKEVIMKNGFGFLVFIYSK